jgi:glycosyltransferase involved in cell wall biosynthesis
LKRVLLVTYAWPPRGGAGLYRPLKWAKYLPDNGWAVTVLTPGNGPASLTCDPDLGRLPGVEVVEVPYRTWRPVRSAMAAGLAPSVPAAVARPAGRVAGLKRFVSDVLDTPDDLWPWVSPAVSAIAPRVAAGEFAAVISTSPPESVHLVASRLTRQYGLPWVADLRDPWTLDHYRSRPGWKRQLLGLMERRVLRRASALVTATDRQLDELHGFLGWAKPADRHIWNGFDPADFPPPQVPATGPFTLVYSGKLHPQHQDPTGVLQAVALLRQRRPLTPATFHLRFRVYGRDLPPIMATAQALGVADLVGVEPPLSTAGALSEQQSATALLLMGWQAENRFRVMPLKTFDYLGSGRPILCYGRPIDPPGRIVGMCEAGKVVETPEAAADALAAWYDEWLKTGTVVSQADHATMTQFDRRAQTAVLASLLDEISR